MELWVEYLMRHNLPLLRPYPNFCEAPTFYVWAAPSYHRRVWEFFLSQNHRYIRTHHPGLELLIHHWAVFGNATVNEQQRETFQHAPFLESLWEGWQNHSFGALGEEPQLAHYRRPPSRRTPVL